MADSMNYYQRTTIRCLCLVGLLATVLLAASPQILVAETETFGPFPPPLGAYYWLGSHNGNQLGNIIGNNDPITFTGGGEADNWVRNWLGRYEVDADSSCQKDCQPGLFRGLAPQDGDTIFFKETLLPPNIVGPFSIGGGSVSLPSSGVDFEIYTDFSGGSFDVAGISIATSGSNNGTFPVSFSGTSFRANQSFSATAVHDTLTLVGATIDSPLIDLNGSYNFEAPAPPPDGTPLIWVIGGSQVKGGVIQVSQNGSPVDTRVNFSESSLSGFGLEVGFSQDDAAAQLNLTNVSDAVPSQFVIVGKQGHGILTLDGGSSLLSPSAYGVIGQDGPGFLHVSHDSQVQLDQIEIGLHKQGDIALDTGGNLITNNAFLGRTIDIDGTVNIEGMARWDTKKLTLGENGNSHVFVRDKGTLKFSEEAVLGKNNGSQGYLDLIGKDAKLELDAGATLSIGEHGTGVLNLSKGAKFTSTGMVNLGHFAGGTSIVTVDGEESMWTAGGVLNIGEIGKGQVEIRNDGTVRAGGASMYLGTNAGSDGTLLIDGEKSKLDFDGEFNIGYRGKGTIRLQNGAKFASDNVTLGHFAGSSGTFDVDNSETGLEETVLDGDLTIGKEGRGIVTAANGSRLTTTGNATLAMEASSGTEEEPSQASIKSSSNWTIDGNLTVAKKGTAKVELSEGSELHVNGGQVMVGEEDDSNGTLVLKGGEHINGPTALFNGRLNIGEKGTGTVEIAGHLVVASDVYVGEMASGIGTIRLGLNGYLFAAGEINIGGLGTGRLLVDDANANVVSTNRIVIDGFQEGHASADFDESAGTLSAPEIVVGESGYGSLSLSEGSDIGTIEPGNAIVPTLRVASSNNSHGQVTITGGAAFLQNLEAGRGGRATIDVSESNFQMGHYVEVDEKITLGAANGGTAKLLVYLDGLVRTKEIEVFAGSEVAIDHSRMTITPGGVFRLNGTTSSPAKLTIGNQGELVQRILNSQTGLSVGTAGVGTVELKSAGHIDLDQVIIGSPSGSNAAGTQMTVSDPGTFLEVGTLGVFKGTSLTITNEAVALVKFSQQSSLFGAASTLQVAGQLTVQSDARLVVSVGGMSLASGGVATFSGGGQGDVKTVVDLTAATINVRGGLLRIGDVSGGVPDELGTVEVLPGGTLKGTGTIDGKVRVLGGTDLFSPPKVQTGHSPGTLTITGDLEADASSVFEMEVAGTGAGQQDLLQVLGNAQIDGNVLLKFIDGFAPTAGDQFTLFTSASLDFGANVFVRHLAPGWQYSVSQLGGAWTVTSLNNAVYLNPGDYNQDGAVNAADYTVWRDSLGQTGFDRAADGNDDGRVDDLDYAVWKDNFGAGPGSGSSLFSKEPLSPAVPEPASLVLLMIAVAGASSFRKGRAASTKSNQLVKT